MPPSKHSIIFYSLALCTSSMISCSSPPPTQANISASPELATSQSKVIEAKPLLKSKTLQISSEPQSVREPKFRKINHNDIHFNLLTFDQRSTTMIVADQKNGPGSVWKDSESAAKERGGFASINAGFFTPKGKPLGLVIDNGTQRGHFNKSSLGTGIYYTTPNGAKITRSKNYSSVAKTKPTYLLQSGPMLIENSAIVAGLSNKNSRVRSFIATDDRNRWLIGHASACTLAELAKALQSISIPHFTLKTALNLDGGRSSDLWVAPSVTGGPATVRAFWNKPVRNFLIIKNK